jgi:hypothetical protein
MATRNVFDLEVQGMEEVIVCRDCGCRSTDDLRGTAAFVIVFRGGGAIQVCKKCADLAKHGQPGLMRVLTKEARDRALQNCTPRHPGTSPTAMVVGCSPARAPSTLERLEHVAACSKWARENA